LFQGNSLKYHSKTSFCRAQSGHFYVAYVAVILVTFQRFLLTSGASLQHRRDMGRTKGTVKSDKAEAQRKLRQRARKIVFDPKKHAVPDEEFDWDEFNYYVDVLAKRPKPPTPETDAAPDEKTMRCVDVLWRGSKPKPSTNRNLKESYRDWLVQHQQWLEQRNPQEAKAQLAWDKMLAENFQKERDEKKASRKPVTRKKRAFPYNNVRGPK
jgi:hypothetical protein